MADKRITRRDVVIGGLGVAGGWGLGKLIPELTRKKEVVSLHVNDPHSRLNATLIKSVERPTGFDDLLGVVRRANRTGDPIAISGSRHAMGGQQFVENGILVDTRSMNHVIDFDRERGLIEVEAGIEWPDLLAYLLQAQDHARDAWTIPVKQTGADRLTLGGAIAANAHGRSLAQGPFINHIESLLLVMADGEVRRCSRKENRELFSLVVGGYGLFGIVHSLVLRLVKRQVIRRDVAVIDSKGLAQAFAKKIADGYTLGDFQYVTDGKDPSFLRRGVFSCYKPVPLETEIPPKQEKISERVWAELVYLAHTDKAKAFQLYSEFYLKTDGQLYWADTSQMGAYIGDYHQKLDERMRSKAPGSEMITEVNVPRERIDEFLTICADALNQELASVIYGTIRLIEPDTESFLPWAKGRFACVIFNLHVDHTEIGVKRSERAFRRLIDIALDMGGSYYLTYHHWATKEQVLRCYPQFPEFLAKKRQYDPKERFQSEWYRRYRKMFA